MYLLWTYLRFRTKQAVRQQWRIQDFSEGVLKVRSDTRRGGGGGGGVLSVSGPIQKAGGGRGGCCRFLARYEK